MKYEILTLDNGSFTVGMPEDKTFPKIANIPSRIFLIRGQDMDPILVDTGFDSQVIPGSAPEWHRPPECELPETLRRIGIAPESIKTVFLTHLHWDHTGGIPYFPNARFVVQRSELDGLLCLNPNEETYFFADHWLPSIDRFVTVSGETDWQPGIRLVPTRSHSPGHQAIVVDTEDGPVVLAGDAPLDYSFLWKTVPQTFWQRYRKGPGSRFYWTDASWTRLKAWLADLPPAPAPDPSAEPVSLEKLGGIIWTAHDPRLKTLDVTESEPVAEVETDLVGNPVHNLCVVE